MRASTSPTSPSARRRCCQRILTVPPGGSGPACSAILAVDVGVIISDTFGRTWRRGVTDVAIGCAGVAAVVDLRGTPDANGRDLVATEVCVADELASAAELVMGKDRGIPAAIVRGVPRGWLRRASVHTEIIRPPEEDLFR